MNKINLIFILLFGLILSANARKPAVEDFVGIEPEGVDFSKAGAIDSFRPYNFEQSRTPSNVPSNNNFILWMLFGMITALPLMSWFVLSRKESSNQTEAGTQNVHRLEDYRKDDDDFDDISKAS